MIADRIKYLRMRNGFSQAEFARKLNITRSSINAWEMGISRPSTQMIIELSNLFHVSTDYILEKDNNCNFIDISSLSNDELHILYSFLNYCDENKKKQKI